ncbi:MAG: CocE/NonD family hydrolase [Actinomycetota bacterium]|nr:CocE/NonD family hydrolase [Actinomycetota bacterium]
MASGADGAALALWRDVPAPLSDGTVLRADIWRPVVGDRVPAVLVRTPYGKERAVPSGALDPATAVSAGFAVVIQDVRGTGTSDGRFEPYVHEADDGFDTIAWVAAQPWCDGRVVMSGMSYVGVVQWLAASRRPPALAALTPTITTDSLGEGWSFRGGVLESGFLRTWIADSLAPPALRVLDGLDAVAEGGGDLTPIAPWSARWFAEPVDSDYWAALGPAPGSVSPDLPALVIAGWYDCFVGGSLRSFADRHGARDRLIVGPWGHEPTLTHLIGERALGSAGSAEVFGLRERALAFYRAVLDGEEPPGPRVLAYLLRAGRWLELDSWPPAGARSLTLDVSSSGSFQADPGALPRALGGRRLQGGSPGSGMGPRDQRPLLGDGHALRLDVAPLADGIVAAGPASTTLAISSTGQVPRQWVAILCVEEAEGELINLAEGVVEAPAAASEVTVELGDICVELERGARLVLVIAGGLARRFPPPAAAAEQRVDGASLKLTVASGGSAS